MNSVTSGRQVSSERILALDALRGLAAVSVLLMHYTTSYDHIYGHKDAIFFSNPYGGRGVELFFMISGFVVLLSLERSRNSLTFAVNRFSRLYPVYWVSAGISLIFIKFFQLPDWPIDSLTAVMNLTMLQGIWGFRDIDPVYWTLLVELKFYFLVGLIFSFKTRQHLNILLIILMFIDILDQQLNLGELPGWGLWRLQVYLPLKHLHLFAIGISLYQLQTSGWNWSHPLLFLMIAINLLLRHSVFASTIVVLLAGILTLAVVGRLRILENHYLLFLGGISYPLYLIHQQIGYLLISEAYSIGINGNVAILIASLTTVAMATVLSVAVERPSNRWLRRQFGTRFQ